MWRNIASELFKLSLFPFHPEMYFGGKLGASWGLGIGSARSQHRSTAAGPAKILEKCHVLCKFVCSVGGQSYSNTDPSGIHWNLRTLNCCMTEPVRNQYRPLRWLKIADSGIRTRAFTFTLMRADRSTNQASRKSRAH